MAEEEVSPINSEEEQEFNPAKTFGLLLGAGVVSIVLGTYFESLLINLLLPVSIMGYYIYEISNKTEETLSSPIPPAIPKTTVASSPTFN